jgi:hypothetical protein
MRKESVVVAAVLFTFAVVAFIMAWVKHDELMQAEARLLAASAPMPAPPPVPKPAP